MKRKLRFISGLLFHFLNLCFSLFLLRDADGCFRFFLCSPEMRLITPPQTLFSSHYDAPVREDYTFVISKKYVYMELFQESNERSG